MRRPILATAFFAVAFAIIGCGDLPRSTVKGRITFNGKPLPGATLIFLTKDNMTYTTGTNADGSYEVSGIPRGPVTVSIQQALPHVSPRPDPNPNAKGGSAKGTGESKD